MLCTMINYVFILFLCTCSDMYSVSIGHPSWGIAWYLNDLLIPELYVERGQTYTFLVEGGNDETLPARYESNDLILLRIWSSSDLKLNFWS